MTGPLPKLLPVSDDDAYAQRELERAITQEASEAPEVVAVFEPPVTAAEELSWRDEEKCERLTDYMLAHDNPRLYSEWGIVR